MSKGQTLISVIMWATGVSVTVATFIYGAASSQFKDINERAISTEGRLSAVETEVHRLPVIENKLDALLQNRGINPSTIQ